MHHHKSLKCSLGNLSGLNFGQVADLTTERDGAKSECDLVKKDRDAVKKECENLQKELAETRDLLSAQVEKNSEFEAQQMNKKRKTRSSLPTC
jgi:uncharacterized protein (DUF3084 family)